MFRIWSQIEQKVLSAIVFIHKTNRIHRDIKSANVLVARYDTHANRNRIDNFGQHNEFSFDPICFLCVAAMAMWSWPILVLRHKYIFRSYSHSCGYTHIMKWSTHRRIVDGGVSAAFDCAWHRRLHGTHCLSIFARRSLVWSISLRVQTSKCDLGARNHQARAVRRQGTVLIHDSS